MKRFVKKYWWLYPITLLVVTGATTWLVFKANPTVLTAQPEIVNCRGARESDFKCWQRRYEVMVMQTDNKTVFADVKLAYEEVPYVYTSCHQIAHVIGRTAGKKYGDVAKAYNEGDNFCWSGYYHGVIEAVAGEMGPEGMVERINEICKGARDEELYSFYHYNCAHGLGHGLMAVQNTELFTSLASCDKLDDWWEKQSCYGGVFMENIMSEINPDHDTKYLRDDDPLYPCTEVTDNYKYQCYLMQTSHALVVVNRSFEKVFELCSSIAAPYDVTCYQSLGRDASGNSVSNIDQTKSWCLLGQTYIARENCIIGAVRDFISFHHDDEQGLALCEAFEDTNLKATCISTATAYYQTF